MSWDCQTCGAHNIEFRETCRECGAPREDEYDEAHDEEEGYGFPVGGKPMVRKCKRMKTGPSGKRRCAAYGEVASRAHSLEAFIGSDLYDDEPELKEISLRKAAAIAKRLGEDWGKLTDIAYRHGSVSVIDDEEGMFLQLVKV